MLSFMGENKRLMNIHEQKFVVLAAFQATTNVLGQYQCIFEKYGDLSRAVGPRYEEPV